MHYREVVISDIHAPYHDPYAVELACKCINVIDPTRIIIAGDLIDAYMLSKFDKDPKRLHENLQNELDVAGTILSDILESRNYNCEVVFIPGNHELRLHRYLCRHPELASLRVLELPTLLSLDEHGIIYYEHEFLPVTTLVVKHGDRVRKYSAYTAKAEIENERYSISTITGHTHRLGSHYATHRTGYVAGYENGCLCDVHPEYVRNPDWQQGFTYITHEGRQSYFANQAIFIGEGKDKHTAIMGQTVRL